MSAKRRSGIAASVGLEYESEGSIATVRARGTVAPRRSGRRVAASASVARSSSSRRAVHMLEFDRTGAIAAVRRSSAAAVDGMFAPSPETRRQVAEILQATGNPAVDDLYAAYQKVMYGDVVAPRRAPLVVPEISDMLADSVAVQCTICLERRIRISQQCGHACYCHACAVKVADQPDPRCVMCTAPITSFAKCYIG